MSFSEQMRQAFRGDWDHAHVDHPTVKGIGDGTLSLERFRFYMAQDYLFLIDYCPERRRTCSEMPV